ncbi:MAG: ACT domain-containing protein [Gammaproteobacteria bacterium]|nr:ACT domain-containing protein [Gammaproteobacteria bacterium]
MTGETSLSTLIRSMAPELIAGEFVFLTFPDARYGDHPELQPIACFQEPEGLTLVVPRDLANQHDLPYDAVFRAITLTVLSSLEAIGLTATFATALAEQGISANVFAGFHHDHILVGKADAERAVTALQELAGNSG